MSHVHSHAPSRTQKSAAASPFKGVGDHTLLRAGSKGAEVKLLQQKLGIKVTGNFDAATIRAVKAYQKQKGLQVDGLVGQQTWGSFYGQKNPPGTHMLKGGKVGGGGGHDHDHGHDHDAGGVHGHNHDHDTFKDPALGEGKRVQAYVNGRATNITVHSVGNGQFMRADAAAAFKRMTEDARRAGINLSATSGFRTMAQQQALYQKYLNGTGNLAAKPGYSNHQNGISMDVGGVNGYGTSAYKWLANNASKYGFVNDVKGEYWHWTFKR